MCRGDGLARELKRDKERSREGMVRRARWEAEITRRPGRKRYEMRDG